MNLDDFPVLSCTRKMVGGAFVKEDMQHDVIKCRVLRVSVPFPVRDVHIQLYVALECLFSIDANSRMNEIGTGLAVPESELDNLNQGADGRAESGPECAGIPQGLPFEFGPFFCQIAGWLAIFRAIRGGMTPDRLNKMDCRENCCAPGSYNNLFKCY